MTLTVVDCVSASRTTWLTTRASEASPPGAAKSVTTRRARRLGVSPAKSVAAGPTLKAPSRSSATAPAHTPMMESAGHASGRHFPSADALLAGSASRAVSRAALGRAASVLPPHPADVADGAPEAGGGATAIGIDGRSAAVREASSRRMASASARVSRSGAASYSRSRRSSAAYVSRAPSPSPSAWLSRITVRAVPSSVGTRSSARRAAASARAGRPSPSSADARVSAASATDCRSWARCSLSQRSKSGDASFT